MNKLRRLVLVGERHNPTHVIIIPEETFVETLRRDVSTTPRRGMPETCIYRDSCAYDVMELTSRFFDEWLLEFIEKPVFSKKEFYENNNGSLRLMLLLTANHPIQGHSSLCQFPLLAAG